MKAQPMFEQLLYIDALRGWDSTGVHLVLDDEQRTYKRALQASDFLDSKGYRKYIYPKVDDALVAIGHNRAATRGDVRDAHAHPFEHKHIVVAHNGFIQNHNSLLPANRAADVDSMVVPYLLAEDGETEGLGKLRGAFALVWYNSQDKTVNIARNEERPMFFGFVEGEKAMFFASELEMINACAERQSPNPVYIEKRYLFASPYQQYKFPVNNPREYTKIPFGEALRKMQPPQVVVIPGVGGTAHSTANRLPERPNGSHTWNRSASTTGTDRRSVPSDGTTDQQIEWFAEYTKGLSKKAKEQCHVPSKKSGLKRVAGKLGRLGYRLGQEISIYLEDFKLYPNQLKFGVVTGSRRSNADVRIEVGNITEADYKEMKKLPYVMALVVNTGKDGYKTTLKCHVRPDRPQEPFNLASTQYRPKAEVLRLPPPVVDVQKLPPMEYVPGPRGLVPVDKFLALVNLGCGMCQDIISPKVAHQVRWYGENPICPECSNDTKQMEELGLHTEKTNAASNNSKH